MALPKGGGKYVIAVDELILMAVFVCTWIN